jgi:hypothetical protein
MNESNWKLNIFSRYENTSEIRQVVNILPISLVGQHGLNVFENARGLHADRGLLITGLDDVSTQG